MQRYTPEKDTISIWVRQEGKGRSLNEAWKKLICLK